MDIKFVSMSTAQEGTSVDGRMLPFEIKRIYYIYDVPNADVRRGFHAHKNLLQILICIKGSCRVLLDDGKQKETVLLDSPSCGLFVDSVLWREMYGFSQDCVLMVLASEHYDESDYIRNYDDFLKYITC